MFTSAESLLTGMTVGLIFGPIGWAYCIIKSHPDCRMMSILWVILSFVVAAALFVLSFYTTAIMIGMHSSDVDRRLVLLFYSFPILFLIHTCGSVILIWKKTKKCSTGKLYTSTFGEKNIREGNDWNNLGVMWSAKGEYDKAIDSFNNALRVDMALHGEYHPTVGRDLSNLGEAWKNKGEYKKAIDYYRKAALCFEIKLGENHPYALEAKENIETLRKKLNYKELQ